MGEAAPITVAIMNDYEVVVKGVARMLEGADNVRVVELNAGLPPARTVDIALYDTFSSSQAGGWEIDALLADPHVDKVVLFSWNVHPDLLQRARAQGVHGYVPKSATADELVAALTRVHGGQSVFPAPDPAGAEAPTDPHPDYPGRAAGLTNREAEVIALISQGLSNADIAERSYLSINSVKSYIRSAYRKIGVQSRPQAILWALENGFATRPVRYVRQD